MKKIILLFTILFSCVLFVFCANIVPSEAVIQNSRSETVTENYDIFYRAGTLTVNAPKAVSMEILMDNKPLEIGDDVSVAIRITYDNGIGND